MIFNGVKIFLSIERGGETSSVKPQQPVLKVLKLERWVIYKIKPID